jgi:rubredoxin
MKKVKIRCWKAVARCSDDTLVTVYFTVSDFGDAPKLFVCSNCGAIFAVDPDKESYSKRKFSDEKEKLKCPECGDSLANVLPSPENFRCPSGEMGRYQRRDRTIPPDDEAVVVEFWDPLS